MGREGCREHSGLILVHSSEYTVYHAGKLEQGKLEAVASTLPCSQKKREVNAYTLLTLVFLYALLSYSRTTPHGMVPSTVGSLPISVKLIRIIPYRHDQKSVILDLIRLTTEIIHQNKAYVIIL